MLRFYGFDLELTVEEVLQRRGEEPAVFSATDTFGERWLIVEAQQEDERLSWICAPVSNRVIELVSAGRADAADGVRHSRTGWVEVVRVVSGHAVPDERVACSALAHCGVAALA
jgi:hypothetical protein